MLCWKVITHWNLSSEASNELIADPAQVISSADTSKLQQFGQAADPQFEVGVSEEDDEALRTQRGHRMLLEIYRAVETVARRLRQTTKKPTKRSFGQSGRRYLIEPQDSGE